METLLITLAIISTIWALVALLVCVFIAGCQRNWRAERAHKLEMEANRADHL